jgi:hypothetical protein
VLYVTGVVVVEAPTGSTASFGALFLTLYDDGVQISQRTVFSNLYLTTSAANGDAAILTLNTIWPLSTAISGVIEIRAAIRGDLLPLNGGVAAAIKSTYGLLTCVRASGDAPYV